MNDPRSMMAESCGLMLKLVFTKCIEVAQINKISFGSSHDEDTKAELSPLSKRKLMLEQVYGLVQ